MACLISAPASGSGKTLLSLVLIAWARSKGLSIQPFKVGPDYLDPQQLSSCSRKPCRNLDRILCGQKWVEQSFYSHSSKADLVIVEGVMGLFDGVGSSTKGSSADIAKHLNLPTVLIVNCRGQAASLGALIKGFKYQDPKINLAGVVLNNVRTMRHKNLLEEVLEEIDIKNLGYLPQEEILHLPSKSLGLIPSHEITDLKKRMEHWAKIAGSCLDMQAFKKLLEAPENKKKSGKSLLNDFSNLKPLTNTPIAIASDEAFHFRYPETKEYLEEMGMPLIPWSPIRDSEIPKQAKGLIIPGGYPEQYAEQISNSKRSLDSVRKFFGKKPIYAECGGMLILGKTLSNLNGEDFEMANLLPFHARQGNLKVGYREIESKSDSLILKKNDKLIGHEYHRWSLEISITKNNEANNLSWGNNQTLSPLWNLKSSEGSQFEEGWGNSIFHASWVHLHWPSSEKVIDLWRKSLI